MRLLQPFRRRLVLAVVAVLATAPAFAHAQSTRQQIDSAVALYNAFNVEAARPILLKITSPGFTQQVSSQEKAEAYKYLGASYAVLAFPDSAVTYFIGALDFDPFTDLDPTKFAVSELAAFNEAKRRLFKVAVRPLPGPRIVKRDSAGADIRFELITTQRANLRVDLAGPRDTVLLYEGQNEGARTIPWQGVLSNGLYAPPGVYQLRAIGTKPGQQPETETVSLRIEHIFEPLEDSLPPLDQTRDLLRERIPGSAPWVDLAKGFGLAVAAVGLPMAALNKDDINWEGHAGVTAVVGISSGIASFLYRRSRPQIQNNVRENRRRVDSRAAFNNGVSQRNAERLNRTLLIVSPVTSFSQ